MKLWLDSEGITKNPKTILRIMHKYDLLSEIRRRKRWRKMGEDKHRYDNWLNREFNAEHPNQKWVTDISYIQTQEGVLYLSMIRDLYDRSIVAYRTGTSQTINLVLDTIHLAMKSVKTESRRELHLHSDQGFQYTSQAYFDLTKEYGILRLCQGVETAMTMHWLKTFSESSKPSASTDTSRKLLRKPTK